MSLEEDDGEDDIPYADYSSDEYGTPLPDNFDAYDSARVGVTNAPPDLLRRKEFYLTPMTLTEAILSVSQFMKLRVSQPSRSRANCRLGTLVTICIILLSIIVHAPHS